MSFSGDLALSSNLSFSGDFSFSQLVGDPLGELHRDDAGGESLLLIYSVSVVGDSVLLFSAWSCWKGGFAVGSFGISSLDVTVFFYFDFVF